MKNNFQIILISIFVFFIILGVVIFASYRATQSSSTDVTISMWGTIDSPSFNGFLSKVKKDLNKEIQINYMQKDPSTFDSELVEAIASGKGPDSIILPQDLIVRYKNKIYPIPYTSFPERTFKDTFIDEGNLFLSSDGIWAMPFFVDPLVMYWNKDMFSDVGLANPPTKWSEFPLLADKFSKSDINANITQSAVALGGFQNINNAKELISALIIQAGNPIVSYVNGAFKSVINQGTTSGTNIQNPAEAALRFYTDYSNPKKSIYSWNSSLPTSKSMFLSGDLAIYFGKASELKDIKEKNPNLNFDVAMLPQTVDAKNKATFGNIYGLAILQSSKNIIPAYTTINSLVGSDVVSIFLQSYDYSPVKRDIISAGTSDMNKKIFYDSALISKGWVDPNSTKTSQIFKEMIDNITTGKLKIGESLQKVNAELDLLL